MKQLLQQLISSGEIYNLEKLNSFLGLADKETIINLYKKYKDTWIFTGTLTYYAEDLPKYEHSKKLENSVELFVLGIIYNALNS